MVDPLVLQLGVLTAAQLLHLARQVWVPERLGRAHVRYAKRAGKTGCSRVGGPAAVTQAVDDIETAFRCLLRCGAAEDVVVVADSLLHLGRATRSDLERWCARAPQRVRRLLLRVGVAESGTESMVRLRLRALGMTVRPQVAIWSGMRVDLLVGDRLVIECDSNEHHSSCTQQQADRARDRALVARGYRVMRLTYRQIHDDWPAIGRDILAVVRCGEHRWPRSADGRRSGAPGAWCGRRAAPRSICRGTAKGPAGAGPFWSCGQRSGARIALSDALGRIAASARSASTR